MEASPDVRAFVVSAAVKWASGRLRDRPDKDQRTGRAFGRDTTGKIVFVPDFTYAFTATVTGEGYNTTDARLVPIPLMGVTEIADVFMHSEIRDEPPGGNDDHLMRPGVPLFIIGDRGLDVWEIGLVNGVASVRLLSWSVVGPWEPFQSNRTKYRIYSQRYRDGRTIDEDFPDSKDAALVHAVCAGDRDAIAAALRNGADANAKGIEGDAPLFWALDCGKLDSLEALLKAGADPNDRLAWAAPYPSRFEVILAYPRQYSVLYEAVDEGNFDAVRLLLKSGGDPNTYRDNWEAETALVLAFDDGEAGDETHDAHAWDTYETLLDADRDINHATSEGETIATHAFDSRRYDRLEELLKRGYSHDLAGLARKISDGTSGDLNPGANDAVALLKQMGVDVPPRLVYVIVRMGDDGSLYLYEHEGTEKSWHIFKGDPRYDALLKALGPLKPGPGKDLTVRENVLPF